MALKLLRIAAGLVFVVFGAGKFVAHADEVDSFRSYGLPAPDVVVYLIGVLELAGGALLVFGLLVRPVAALLACNMAVAIVVSGIKEGEVFPSLTLAPALLVVMLLLLKPGKGFEPSTCRLQGGCSTS
jgi:putative oxidoreductase